MQKLSKFYTLILECTDNTHCKDASKSKCDTGKNTCVGKLYEVDQRIEYHRLHERDSIQNCLFRMF